jgi:hypothetical protein
LTAGTPQTATIGSAFQTNLQVAFTNSNDCPVTSTVAGTPVTFSDVSASLADKPAKLTVGVGATQSTPTGTRFPIGLAVTVTNAQKTPLPGVLVMFVAPSRGPSGAFAVRSGGAHNTSRSRRVEVRTDACGVALAPAFTANSRAGGYVLVASVEHVRAAFALVNEGR